MGTLQPDQGAGVGPGVGLPAWGTIDGLGVSQGSGGCQMLGEAVDGCHGGLVGPGVIGCHGGLVAPGVIGCNGGLVGPGVIGCHGGL